MERATNNDKPCQSLDTLSIYIVSAAAPSMVPRIVFKTIAVQTLEEHWIVLS